VILPPIPSSLPLGEEKTPMSSRHALTLAAALALLVPAALAPAASVRLDFAGTSSFTDDTASTSGTESYTASVTYDPAAIPPAPAPFPLAGYTGYNTGILPFGSDVKLQDDVTLPGFTGPVDVITFDDSELSFAGLPVLIGNSITLTTTPDFLTGLQLPTLAD